MNILFLGTDRNLLSPLSAVFARIRRLATRFPEDSFTTIVFSSRAHGVAKPVTISEHASAYPTHSLSRFLYGIDALRIAKTLPRPDIISAQDPFETGLIAWLIARVLSVSYVVEVHTDFLTPSFRKHSFLNRIRVAIAGFVLKRAAGGYAVSAGVRDDIVTRYRLTVPFTVLPIFVDVRAYAGITHLAHPRFKTSLLWVGRLEEEKQPMIALEALRVLVSEGNVGVGLTIVGEGSMRANLEAWTGVQGLSNNVIWCGWQEDMRPYYAMADLVLVTSSYEGYSMVSIEALAAHVPVLATPVGIAREAGASIAEDNYTKALRTWLMGPKTPGILLLTTYTSEEDYLDRLHKHYASLIIGA